MATDVAKSLKKLSKVWSKTEPKQASGFSRLPDGKYVVNLVEMKVGISKKDRLQVATKFKVVKPKDAKGKETMTFHGLENENNIAYFKGFAEVLGLEVPDDIEDLPAAVESFVSDFEDTLTVELKTKGDYQNLSIVAVGDSEVGGEEEEDDDDNGNDKEEEEEEEEEEEDNKNTKKEAENKKPVTQAKKESDDEEEEEEEEED